MKVSKQTVYTVEVSGNIMCLLSGDMIRLGLNKYNCSIDMVFEKFQRGLEPKIENDVLPSYSLKERKDTLLCRVSDNEVVRAIADRHAVFQADGGVYCAYGVFVGIVGEDNMRVIRIPTSLILRVVKLARGYEATIVKEGL